MTKVRMTQVGKRAAPVLLAAGLWLVGNGLLGMQSAKGQEVAGNFKTPVYAPYDYFPINNCVKYGSCTRVREDIWGCKPAGWLDSCNDNVTQAVSVHKDKTTCTMSDPGGSACDWNPANNNITLLTAMPDACEISSKKTGSITCAEASLPLQEHRWKNNQEFQLAFNPNASKIVRGH